MKAERTCKTCVYYSSKECEDGIRENYGCMNLRNCVANGKESIVSAWDDGWCSEHMTEDEFEGMRRKQAGIVSGMVPSVWEYDPDASPPPPWKVWREKSWDELTDEERAAFENRDKNLYRKVEGGYQVTHSFDEESGELVEVKDGEIKYED